MRLRSRHVGFAAALSSIALFSAAFCDEPPASIGALAASATDVVVVATVDSTGGGETGTGFDLQPTSDTSASVTAPRARLLATKTEREKRLRIDLETDEGERP